MPELGQGVSIVVAKSNIGYVPFSWPAPAYFGGVEARMADIVEELRTWAKRIRRDAEVNPHAASVNDSDLLDRAANEIESLRGEIETLRSD
jgi:hypothetical protein